VVNIILAWGLFGAVVLFGVPNLYALFFNSTIFSIQDISELLQVGAKPTSCSINKIDFSWVNRDKQLV
jgi:hypothetical protein